MTTQSQAQTQAAGSETIRRVVPEVVGTPVDESAADAIVAEVESAPAAPTKKSAFGRAKAHVSNNRGKYAFGLGCAVGAAVGIGYSIWKVGGAAADQVDLIGDTPV